ncbi:hypothetical protein RRG08_030123 [Elysia crispata]|uniref:Uncharacterized protein n=1 Tax=Elysia crispata TaxID=231223 RepID=A0AAE0ZSA3_9GAST|nr:hypothetical protein RRG08_030123 [Elysia crispata]
MKLLGDRRDIGAFLVRDQLRLHSASNQSQTSAREHLLSHSASEQSRKSEYIRYLALESGQTTSISHSNRARPHLCHTRIGPDHIYLTLE